MRLDESILATSVRKEDTACQHQSTDSVLLLKHETISPESLRPVHRVHTSSLEHAQDRTFHLSVTPNVKSQVLP